MIRASLPTLVYLFVIMALKKYVLDESGYRSIGEDFKIKSRLYPREIRVSNAQGKRSKVQIDEKQVIFYSADYARSGTGHC